MKALRKNLPLVIIIFTVLIGVYLYPQLPEQMASHWNIHGEADGYSSKLWGTFFAPIMMILLYLLFLYLPKIDPLKENIKKFRVHFDNFIIIIFTFLLYLYLLILAWNLGINFNFSAMMVPALAILIYYSGILIENAKRNWFIGIRTPWTLSNEKVWNKTHKLGGKLFKNIALVMLIGVVFPDLAFYLMIFPLLAVTIYLFLYSYIQYRQI